MHGSLSCVCQPNETGQKPVLWSLKDPKHDCDFKPQPPTKFPVYGHKQPQPWFASRGCCWSELSDIYNTELQFN